MWFSSCANQDQEHFHTHLTKGLVRVNSGLCRNWLGLHRWSCCRRAALLNNEVPSHVNKTTQIFLHMFENTVLFPSSLIHSNLQRLKHFPEYFVFFLLLFLRWGDSSGSIVVSFWGIETKTGIFLKKKKKRREGITQHVPKEQNFSLDICPWTREETLGFISQLKR